jgi:alcohol dehydrogenase (cytochrome c)
MESEFKESIPYWGGDATVKPEQVHGGEVRAIDPATGQAVWMWRAPHPIVASLLTTGGGLVFVGEPTGDFKALNARTGQVLWNFQTGSGIHSGHLQREWKTIHRRCERMGRMDEGVCA